MGKNKLKEIIERLTHYWECDKNLELWKGWKEHETYLETHFPELIHVWENYKKAKADYDVSKKIVDAIIDNLEYKLI